MKFAQPLYFIALIFLPLIALLFVFLFKKRQKNLQLFANIHSIQLLLPHFSPYRKVIKQALWLLTFFSLILALVGPQWGYHFEEVSRKGVDLFILADVSSSMMAEDLKPNRLEQLKRKVHDLLKLSQGDRIGLIVFAGKAVVLCPLTLDYQAIEQFIEDLSPDLISIQGTNMTEALRLARQSFKDTKTSKALFLITDGEDHSEALEKEVKELKQNQIPLYILGIGTAQGAPIPLEKGEGGFKRDEAGNVVVSQLKESVLSELALASGGEYTRSVTTDEDLNTLYVKGLKGALSSSEFKASKKKVYEHRYQWPLAFALLFLIIEFMFSDYKKAGALFLFFFLLLTPQQSSAFTFKSLEEVQGSQNYKNKKYEDAQKHFQNNVVEDPQDAKNAYNLGNAYYQQKLYDSAAESFVKAAQNAEDSLKAKALYNLGNSLYKMGELEKSISAYEKSLEVNAKDQDTQMNLEFVKRKLQEKQNQQAQQEKDENKKQEQDQNQTQGEGENKSQNNQASQDPKQGSQDQQQENQSQKQNQEQQSPKNKTEQAQDSKKTEDQNKQNSQSQAQTQTPDGQGKESDDKKQPAKASALQEAQKGSKNTQEAEMWLGAIDENQSQILKNQIDKKLGSGRRVKKDW